MVEIEGAFQSILHANFFVSQILHNLEVCWTIFCTARGVLWFTSIAVCRPYHDSPILHRPRQSRSSLQSPIITHSGLLALMCKFTQICCIFLYSFIKCMFCFHFCLISSYCTIVSIHVWSTLRMNFNFSRSGFDDHVCYFTLPLESHN